MPSLSEQRAQRPSRRVSLCQRPARAALPKQREEVKSALRGPARESHRRPPRSKSPQHKKTCEMFSWATFLLRNLAHTYRRNAERTFPRVQQSARPAVLGSEKISHFLRE